MPAPFATQTDLLFHRLLDNNRGARSLLRNNITFGVRLACLLTAVHFVRVFEQMFGLVSDFSFVYDAFVFAILALGLGFAISSFCNWAHHAIERRIERLRAELHGSFHDCCDLILQSGEPAGSKIKKRPQRPGPLPRRTIRRPPWLQYPVVVGLLMIFVFMLSPFYRGQSGDYFRYPPMKSATFLNPYEHQLVIYLQENGTTRIGKHRAYPRTVFPEQLPEEVVRRRAAGFSSCVLLADENTKVKHILRVKAELQAAGFEKIVFGERVDLWPN